jgi:multidrug efflux pump subunit AcrB
MKLGLSGLVTRTFIQSPLTPLLLLASLAIGGLALALLPREEEPQISVPIVDILVQADGLKATDAVELVTEPLEDIINGIDGVEHVYSSTEDNRVLVTARFLVGHDEDAAILRVHAEVRANLDRIPIGIPEPLIIGRGINDVAILVVTLSPEAGNAGRWTDTALYELAEELRHEVIKEDGVGLTYIVGGRASRLRVEPDPERLALYGIALNQLVEKVGNANRAMRLRAVRQADRMLPVVAGQTLQGGPDIGRLLVTSMDGRPVYLRDVADIVVAGDTAEHRAWHMRPGTEGSLTPRPAVSLAIAKRQGANAVAIAEAVRQRIDDVRRRLIPDGVEVTITRDYGETAAEKANELLGHLLGATVSIVVLLTLFLGWRAGVVVFFVIPTTILLTFFAAWMMGYTINRVSMFALIFAIGILVDDAIVVVENIVRHWQRGNRGDLVQAAIAAVAEVGNPTIVATFTIIVALLPMLFVSGLMGPYMSPIPAVASAAMLFSLLMALIVTPWLMLKLGHRPAAQTAGDEEAAGGEPDPGGVLGRVYLLLARPLLRGRWRARLFLLAVTVATLASLGLFYSQDVVVKLLPFDDKSELQVVVDLPEGHSLERTERTLMALARALADLPELEHLQAYAGTAAPFNFNGLVRHSYLRSRPEQGELQLGLAAKHDRERASHAIALDVRQRLARVPVPAGTAVKVVEVPPGPPVIATLLAEVYGPDAESRRRTAGQLRQVFESIDFIVDTDDSFGAPAPQLHIATNQESLEFHRVEEGELFDTLQTLLNGRRVGYSHRGGGANPIEIFIGLPRSARHLSERMLSTPVPTEAGGVVEVGDLVRLSTERASYPIFRRDGRFAEMVMAELAGRFEAPIYGMLAVQRAIEEIEWGADGPPEMRLVGQPRDEAKTSLLWDGEWEITYVTFRDMGAAFMVAMVGIYFLVVGQFGGFKVPLLVLVPIPLTLIGIMLGHWLFEAAFTATSMIGFIALAGIIVRNSILLVDFIKLRQAEGMPLRQSLLAAGAIRFKPIFLTAVTAMVGAGFILTDPIFQGLAISLLFGLASSTLLTVLVIPAIYVWLRDDGVALT